MTRAAKAHIDLHAFQHNLSRVREQAPDSKVIAVIKANGYGHGLVTAARALRDADAFAVARLEEAVCLREEGFAKPILLLEGISDERELAVASDRNLELVVHNGRQLELLEASRAKERFRIWVKVDTGMHRLGFLPEQLEDVWQRLLRCSALKGSPVIMTHLANADVRGDARTQTQLEIFSRISRGMVASLSIANSGAILSLPESHQQWVRPGIMLYGASPFDQGRAAQEGLLPVMTLSTRIISVKQCRAGDQVGYGGEWSCPEDMPVGVAAIGYGDGYPRHARAGTPVLVNGQRMPLIGRVSMDMITLDLRGQPDVEIGDPVILWGEGLPVEEVAQHASTIAYELLCHVTSRVVFEEV